MTRNLVDIDLSADDLATIAPSVPFRIRTRVLQVRRPA
ncbi:hypothetical protein EJMOOK_08060 [Rhodanobacter sp. Root179]|jgi:hypothetical protein